MGKPSNYRCNQCLYRANSLIHIQIHGMVFHYDIWSKRNSNISQHVFDVFSEDFCKVFVEKSLVFGPKRDPSVWLPTVTTDLDRDLAQNEFYCNFCDFHNKEVIHIFIHIIQRHSDLDVCAPYRGYNPKLQNCIPIEEPEESNDDVEVIVTKDPVHSLRTQCAPGTQSIPGFDYIATPKRVPNTRNNTRRRLSFQPSDEDNYDLPVDEEFDDITDPMIAPNVSQIPRNDAFSDDMNQIQANSAYYDFTQSSSGYNQPKSNDMKRAIGSEARSQGQRVYNRSTHSSALARKRQKAEYSSDSEEDIENQNQKHIQRDPEESNISSDVPKKLQYLSSESEEDMETNVNNESDVESVIISEIRVQQTSNHSSSRPSVAKKSTAKPTNESLNASQRVILTEDMHRKYRCVFCTGSFIINDLMEAIEHYKAHLKLEYTCAKCGFTCDSLMSMEFHSKNVHKNEEMDFKDNLDPIVCNWIKKFLEDQHNTEPTIKIKFY